jgi:glycogen debranching enzyme
MTMFCNYGHPFVPGVSSLDNFYARQHEDGEICREISRAAGADYGPWTNPEGRALFSRWGWPDALLGAVQNQAMPVEYVGRIAPVPAPRLTLDALNHPIAAWAELVYVNTTGDTKRLAQVWTPLVHYYSALQTYLRQGNGLYMTDWASMDNSPRNYDLRGGGTAIDTSSEMVLFARNLAEIGSILGKSAESARFGREADELASLINAKMWDPHGRFYFDLTLGGQRSPIRTVAAYWTLLAGVASKQQAAALAAELKNPETFGRHNLVPTLAANQPGYDPSGGYWRGAVWSPIEAMIVEGLEKYGHSDLARTIALNHLNLVAGVCEKTGTIWENYAPDTLSAGAPARQDFVGWSGLAPITFLIEYGIGLKPDAMHNRLVWTVPEGTHSGCDSFRFNNHVVSLHARKSGAHGQRLSISSDGRFQLVVRHGKFVKTLSVKAGRNEFLAP